MGTWDRVAAKVAHRMQAGGEVPRDRMEGGAERNAGRDMRAREAEGAREAERRVREAEERAGEAERRAREAESRVREAEERAGEAERRAREEELR